jgi:hypothetical protein
MALHKSVRYNEPQMTEKPKFRDNFFFLWKCPVQIPAKYVKRFMGQMKKRIGGSVNIWLVLLTKTSTDQDFPGRLVGIVYYVLEQNQRKVLRNINGKFRIWSYAN